ncbi:hypothetical protein TRAPUB_8643 [Trametes pubescens]|uniref:Uncharacterized protein n=1 Tax=Trametes pubescens TaxID=154538 RepID=A0A1M2W4K4_TRAPU|nr:hypothetical protein TRAPUB_8643 [Trametes pubescens]
MEERDASLREHVVDESKPALTTSFEKRCMENAPGAHCEHVGALGRIGTRANRNRKASPAVRSNLAVAPPRPKSERGGEGL